MRVAVCPELEKIPKCQITNVQNKVVIRNLADAVTVLVIKASGIGIYFVISCFEFRILTV